MKRMLLLGTLAAGAAWSLQGIADGHGGTYRGPGDTVPPGAGGGGAGGGPTSPGPTGPTGGTPGPSTPGSSTPGRPGHAPGPAGGAIFTPGGDLAPDLTAWDFWWGFNREPYLSLKDRIHTGGTVTGDDDYWLGQNTKQQRLELWKPNEQTIHDVVIPALKRALREDRANDVLDSALIALAKIGDVVDESGESELVEILAGFLDHPSQQVAETAAVALGILADLRSVPALVALLTDAPEGRALVGTTEVPMRTRAFAAYGLGLVAYRASDNEARRRIAETLADVLTSPTFATRDIKVACMTSFGLCPVDSDPLLTGDGLDPGSNRRHVISREAQLAFLLDYFDPALQAANKTTRHWFVRAHAPTAMARLLEGVDDTWRGRVAAALLAAVAEHSAEQQEVRMSCALALGRVGDASDDGEGDVDPRIRSELVRLVADGEPQVRRFALIAMAQAAGRPGRGEHALAGQEDVERELLTVLARGNTGLRPWAGLAVGVMCRALLDNGERYPTEALAALRLAATECRRPGEIGAYVLGMGIARYAEGRELCAEKMEYFAGADDARGYCAVALGLMGDRRDIATIQDVVRSSRYRPELLKQAAIGLGLLGDKDLAVELADMLKEAKGLSTQAAIATALGTIGDTRSIGPLVAMLQDRDHLTDTARGFAAAALGIVCDKESLPWNAKISTDINYRANTSTLQEGANGILDLL